MKKVGHFARSNGSVINEMRLLFTYSWGFVRQQDHEHAELQVATAVEATWYCKFGYWCQSCIFWIGEIYIQYQDPDLALISWKMSQPPALGGTIGIPNWMAIMVTVAFARCRKRFLVDHSPAFPGLWGEKRYWALPVLAFPLYLLYLTPSYAIEFSWCDNPKTSQDLKMDDVDVKQSGLLGSTSIPFESFHGCLHISVFFYHVLMELEYHKSHGHNEIKQVHKSKALQTYEDLFVLCTYPTCLPDLNSNSCSHYFKMMVSLIRFKRQVDAFIMYGHEYMGVLVAERPTFTSYFIRSPAAVELVPARCLVAPGHHTIDRSMLDDHHWSPWLRDVQVKLVLNESNSTTSV